MQLDLSVGVGEEVSEVNGGRGVSGFAVAGVGDMELGSLDGSARNAVLFENGEFRSRVVLENQFLDIAGVQADGWHPMALKWVSRL